MEDCGLSCEAVRKRILAEHERLREASARVLAAEGHAKLTLAMNALLDLLAEHLADEDELLAPLVRILDAWGEERARRLTEEHTQQREEMSRIRFALAHPLPVEEQPALASALRQFVDRLRGDMAAEERDLVNAELLHDDTITVEFGG
jgi:hypothetical protein